MTQVPRAPMHIITHDPPTSIPQPYPNNNNNPIDSTHPIFQLPYKIPAHATQLAGYYHTCTKSLTEKLRVTPITHVTPKIPVNVTPPYFQKSTILSASNIIASNNNTTNNPPTLIPVSIQTPHETPKSPVTDAPPYFQRHHYKHFTAHTISCPTYITSISTLFAVPYPHLSQ